MTETFPETAAHVPGPRYALAALLIVALAAVVAFAGLDRMGALSEHEALVAQTTREMSQRGEWIVPWYGGSPRVRKSPLAYWLVGLSSSLHGQLDERAVRVPSALAGIATVATTLWFGTMLLGRRGGLAAGFVAATAAWLFWFSHAGTAEIHLTFWCTLTLALVWRAWHSQTPAGRWTAAIAAALACGLAWYAKAPMPLLFIGLPAGLYPLLRRPEGWRRRHVPIAAGVMLTGLLLFLPWAMAVYVRVPEAASVWQAEIVGRMAGTLRDSDAEPWYYYLPFLLLFPVPWALSVFEGLAAPFLGRYRGRRADLLYAWLAVVGVTIVLSASAGKKSHYLGPVLPALSILVAATVDRLFLTDHRIRRGAVLLTVGLVLCGLAGGSLVGFFYLPGPYRALWPVYLLAYGIAVGGVALAGALFLVRRRRLSMAAVGVTSVLACLAAVPSFAHEYAETQYVRAVAEGIREVIPPEAEAYWLLRQDAPVMFYSDRILPRFETTVVHLAEDESPRILAAQPRRVGRPLDARLRERQPVYVVMRQQHLSLLTHYYGTPARVLFRLGRDPEEPGDDLVVVTNAYATADAPASRPAMHQAQAGLPNTRPGKG